MPSSRSDRKTPHHASQDSERHDLYERDYRCSGREHTSGPAPRSGSGTSADNDARASSTEQTVAPMLLQSREQAPHRANSHEAPAVDHQEGRREMAPWVDHEDRRITRVLADVAVGRVL